VLAYIFRDDVKQRTEAFRMRMLSCLISGYNCTNNDRTMTCSNARWN